VTALREAEAGVLGVVPADQLGLGLGEVERGPVGLGQAGQDEHQEHGELRDHEPVGQETQQLAGGLDLDDAAGGQGAGVHDHADQRQALGDLVADHLGAGAHPAKQRVVGPGRVPGQHDPVHLEAGHGQHEQ
jgi:hypothetical protein